MKIAQHPDLRPSLKPIQAKDDEISPAQRKKLAAQFESLLVHELVKSMRSTVNSGDGDFGVSMSMDMMDQSLSDAVSGRLGLGEHLLKQLGGSSTDAPALSKRVPARKATTSPDGLPTRRPLPSLVPTDTASSLSNQKGSETDIIQSAFGPPMNLGTAGPISPLGTELAADQEQEIYALRKGTVIFAGSKKGWGQTVELKHDDGSVSRYAHATRIHVRVGDRIEAGECVADGAPGSPKTLPFEIHKFGASSTNTKDSTP